MAANDPWIYSKPIYTYTHQGKSYILDGHHRIKEAIQNNQNIQVIELNTRQAIKLFKDKVKEIHDGLHK